MHPDDIDAAVAAWTRVDRRPATPTKSNSASARFDGVYRWHLVRALPVRDEEGKVVRWVGTNTDIERPEGSRARRLNELQQVSARTAERDRMWRLATDMMLVAD